MRRSLSSSPTSLSSACTCTTCHLLPRTSVSAKGRLVNIPSINTFVLEKKEREGYRRDVVVDDRLNCVHEQEHEGVEGMGMKRC